MTAKQDISDNEMKISEDRIVTDSVHERFRQLLVHCDTCNCDVEGNETAIRKHFNKSHPSNKHCCYCKGKVFVYRNVVIADRNETPQEFVYHRCEYKE